MRCDDNRAADLNEKRPDDPNSNRPYEYAKQLDISYPPWDLYQVVWITDFHKRHPQLRRKVG